MTASTPPAGGGSLILIGSMGAGKSSVARQLAQRLGWRWVDTDRLVVQAAGMTIPEIFAKRGEAHFRELESAAVRSLGDLGRVIVATGGGVVLRPENREQLRALGHVVWLTATEDVLLERVSRTRKRPLLETEDPRASLRELLAAREPLYRECAHQRIDTSELGHAQVAEAVLLQTGQTAGFQTAARA